MPSSPARNQQGSATVVSLPDPHTLCPPEIDLRRGTISRRAVFRRTTVSSSNTDSETESGTECEHGDMTLTRRNLNDESTISESVSMSKADLEMDTTETNPSTFNWNALFIRNPVMEHFDSPETFSKPVSSPTSSLLRAGSKFVGTQQSDRQVYNVQVEIKDVDMLSSTLCGYLRIQGLTDDHPTLTTFFEGEIISGNKYTFKTAHPEWGSTEKVDMQHWARFPAWKPLAKQARSSQAFSSSYSQSYAQREHLFMRWKEYFLVPDHRVKTINGASFEGFYYICFNQKTGGITGIYFHAKSEKYQNLELEHVNDRGCFAATEVR